MKKKQSCDHAQSLRILLLEDSEYDAELILHELQQAQIQFTAEQVETRRDFEEKLRSFMPDMVLSDYSLPSFDGQSALEITRKEYPDLPFILVSGALGEEFAVDILKKGATDYVLKSRLFRLIPVVERALRESEERRERRVAEEALKKYTEDLEQSRNDLRQLASEMVLAEERERKRIAVTLHDEVAQLLAASRMRLDLLKSILRDDEHQKIVEEARDLLVQSIKETRALMTNISSHTLLEMGLDSAVQSLAEDIRARQGISVSYSFSGQIKNLGQDVSVTIYQLVKELMQNVIKHSHARSANIRIAKEKNSIWTVVADDGLGFDVNKAYLPGQEGGFGLFSIRERVKFFNGSMKIESVPGTGTEVTVVLPSTFKKKKNSAKRNKTSAEAK